MVVTVLPSLVPAADPVAAAEVRWLARLAFDERYDDNITQLSPKDLDRLDTQGGGNGFGCGSGSTDTRAGRFSIETPDDHVSIPQISSSLAAGWLEGRPTTFNVDIAAYQYARNSIKSWQSYRVEANQPLHGGKFETTIDLSYTYVPYDYVRNLRSDRTANDLGVLPPPRREATYRSHTAGLRVEQVLVPRYLSLRGLVGRELRNYNHCFDERDSDAPFRQVELAWEPLGNHFLRVRGSFRREDLHAAGDLPETQFFTEPDISSRRETRFAEVYLHWGPKGRKTTVSLRYEAEHRDYTTTNPNDIFHFGRTDERRHAAFAARIGLGGGWFLTAGGEHGSNRSSFPVVPGSTFSPEDTTDYDENLYQLGLGYDFSLAGSSPSGGSPERPRK